MMNKAEGNVILEYGHQPAIWQRRSFRRAAVWIVLAVAAGVVVHWGKEIIYRLRVVYVQQQCMNHVIPPDKVILSIDRKEAPALLNDPEYVPLECGAGYRPGCFRELEKLLGLPPNPNSAVIFMHRLKSSNGVERLVVVTVRAETRERALAQDDIEVTLLEPRTVAGTLNGLGDVLPRTGSGGRRVVMNYPSIRYGAGKLDPADPSHFTIRFARINPNDTDVGPYPSGVLDYHLSADGMSVELGILR